MQWIIGAAFVVAWSSGFVGATLADHAGADTWALLAWRYLITAAVLLLACMATPAGRKALQALSRRDLVQQLMLAIMSHVLFLGGVFAAARQGLDAGLSALVCALQPLLVTTASRVVFSDPIKCRQWGGLLLALAGVALSVGGIGLGSIGSVVWVVISLLGLSTASMFERFWAPNIPVMSSLTVQVCAAAIAFSSIALIANGLQLPINKETVLSISWLVILSGLLGYAAFIWCLRHIGATTTSTLLYLTAPVTMLWAWMMFQQQPSLVQWAGLAVVLTGVAIATWHTTQPSTTQ